MAPRITRMRRSAHRRGIHHESLNYAQFLAARRGPPGNATAGGLCGSLAGRLGACPGSSGRVGRAHRTADGDPAAGAVRQLAGTGTAGEHPRRTTALADSRGTGVPPAAYAPADAVPAADAPAGGRADPQYRAGDVPVRHHVRHLRTRLVLPGARGDEASLGPGTRRRARSADRLLPGFRESVHRLRRGRRVVPAARAEPAGQWRDRAVVPARHLHPGRADRVVRQDQQRPERVLAIARRTLRTPFLSCQRSDMQLTIDTSLAPRLLEFVRDSEAVEDLASNYQDGPPGTGYSGRWFERIGTPAEQHRDRNRLTADDIVAISALGIRLSITVSSRLLGEDEAEISVLLTQIPADVNLWNASRSDLGPRSAAGRLFQK